MMLDIDQAVYLGPRGQWVRLGNERSKGIRGGDPEQLGKFHSVGADIFDPEGYVFVPRGFNVGGGLQGGNGNGWPDYALNPEFRDGMKAWAPVNSVRLTFYVTDRNSWSLRGKAITEGKSKEEADAAIDTHVRRLVSFWRSAGFVVMVEAHDITGSPLYADGVLSQGALSWISQIQDFWRRNAEVWKNDTGVWFNLANEPNLREAEWHTFTTDTCAVIREEVGADNMIVADLLYYSSDSGLIGDRETAPFGYDDHMIPARIERFGNIIASQHNYGSWGVMVTDQRVDSHYAMYRTKGIPLLIGEIGWPAKDGDTGIRIESNAGMTQYNIDGGRASMKAAAKHDIGVFWWAVNFGDQFRIYDPTRTNTNSNYPVRNPFAQNPSHPLNEAGVEFRAYLEASKASVGR